MSVRRPINKAYYLVSDKRSKDVRYGMVTNGRIILGVVQFKVLWENRNEHEWVKADDLNEESETD